MQLESLGFTVTATNNTDQALRVMRSEPDMRLMVVDSNISGQIGALELAVTAQSIAPNLRVIIASGFWNSALSEKAANSRWTLLRKPFSWSEFSSAIRETLAA